MWADALLVAERHHILRLAVWGAACVLAGTGLVLALTVRRSRSPLLQHFAIQTGAWGLVTLVIALLASRSLDYRDLAGFTWLDRFLWLNLGLNVGYVAVGLTLALTGWRLGRRQGLVGAGAGVVVQGLALFVLDAYLLGVLQRLAAG